MCEWLFGEIPDRVEALASIADAAGGGMDFFSRLPAPLSFLLSVLLAAFLVRVDLQAAARLLAASASLQPKGAELRSFRMRTY